MTTFHLTPLQVFAPVTSLILITQIRNQKMRIGTPNRTSLRTAPRTLSKSGLGAAGMLTQMQKLNKD